MLAVSYKQMYTSTCRDVHAFTVMCNQGLGKGVGSKPQLTYLYIEPNISTKFYKCTGIGFAYTAGNPTQVVHLYAGALLQMFNCMHEIWGLTSGFNSVFLYAYNKQTLLSA